MKPVSELLAQLGVAGITFTIDGEHLHVSAPKGTLTPELRAELAQRKPEIVTFLGEVGFPSDSDSAPIQPVLRVRPQPASFAQQRLWLLDQLEPGNSAYNLSRAYRLTGPLDVAALEQGLNAIVQRHEVLRTTLGTSDGQPVQIVAPSLVLSCPVVDLQGTPADDQESEAFRRATAKALRPFDLSTGPLLRVCLFRLGEQDHVLLTVMHHIVTDGWSQAVFCRELAVLYRAFRAGQSSPLPELPLQYADYAVWQQEWLQGEALESLLAYWRQQVGTDLSTLQLPTSHPRPALQTYRGAHHWLSLSEGLTQALKALGRQERATLFMTLLAAFNTLLSRYTGQLDIVVGSPIAGRNRVEIEGLIGFFINMLVLRTDLSGNPSFRQVLRRVRAVCLGAYSHQDLPFDRLVEELQPRRDASRHPLFQVTFALQNTRQQHLDLDGLAVRRLELDRELVRFDLEVHFRETDAGLLGHVIYNTDLFDAATIVRMADHFETLLHSIVATEKSPDRPVAELALLTEEERQQIVVEWNDTSTGYPRAKGVQQLFEAQVEQRPDATAVEWGHRRWTYRELDGQANQLAHRLRSLGVGPDVLVGLCLERSPEMVLGMLGILKAGAAYVPLDPEYPAERLAFMLEDSRAPVVLTQERLRAALPETRAEVIYLDADWEAGLQHSGAQPANWTGPESLAYVIYTSGSTGRPKGVAVPHRAIVRLVRDTDYVQLQASDRIAQASTASFDAATFEVWGALLNGACLVGVDPETVLSPEDLAAHLRQKRINVLFLTTALFNQLAATVPHAFQGLRDLMFGGEAVAPRWVREVLEKGPPERLLHVYGPTENTTFTTWHLVREVNQGAATVPIGRPIANTRVYVLDKRLQPVPVGVPGELYIGGDGLGRGYLHRPGRTAERFVPNPFDDTPGARLYQTGDLVRYLAAGNIEFLGRYDRQVKLRGFRIELGEIETVLEQHPAVRQAVVTARDDLPGGRGLAAYLVADHMNGPALKALRTYVRERLPGYMEPTTWLFLDSLPLTSNGKVDLQALPVPSGEERVAKEAFTAPRDGIERQLVRIWEEVLGVQPVGTSDDFFDLGGHSLLGIRMFARIDREMGKTLPAALLFESPTVGQLAQAIRGGEASPDWTTPVPIQVGGSRPPFFCVHGFGGGVLGYAELARQLGPDQPFYGLLAKGLNGREEPDARIEDMATHSLQAMQRVQPQGPYQLGGYCYGGVVAYEMACQLRAQGEQVALLAILEGYAPNRAEALGQFSRLQVAARTLFNLPYWLRDILLRPGAYGRLMGRVYHRLGSDENLCEWDERLPGGVDADLDDDSDVPEHHRRLLAVHRQALRDYNPGTYSGRLTLFRVRSLVLLRSYDPEMGWGLLATGAVEVKMIAGAHYNFLEQPYVQLLAAKLTESLKQARSDGTVQWAVAGDKAVP